MQVRSRFKAGFESVRKRSQSAGPGKFDKKIGKEDSFDQVTPTFPSSAFFWPNSPELSLKLIFRG